LVGLDVFVDWQGTDPNPLAEMLKKIQFNGVEFPTITNRGIKVWPNGFKETFCTDHWRCRFKPTAGNSFNKENIIQLLQNAVHQKIDVIKTENLYAFNGKDVYSLGQGQ
jgi:isocitrate dehydrogenase